MPNWFLPALLTVLFWGVWGVLLKLAVDRLGTKPTFFIHSMVFFACVLVYKLVSGFKLATQTTGMVLTVAAAVCSMLGAFFFIQAMARGKASAVVPFAALYPALTVALSLLLLKERLTSPQWLGVALAVVAGILLGR